MFYFLAKQVEEVEEEEMQPFFFCYDIFVASRKF